MRTRANDRRTLNGRDRPVLVAGGAGFIGSHLCERLLREHRDVICVDNFCTSDGENVTQLSQFDGFQLRRCDVSGLEPAEFDELGAVFNLACAASPKRYQSQPLATLFTCVQGMDRLLQLARRDHARLFYASTSEIYGHPQVHPQKEDYRGYVNSMGPRACYNEGKRCGETLCFIYQQEYSVAVRVGRIFNTYGPRMHLDDGRVVVNFISQALSNRPITICGDGTQTRSFCYVDDLVEAIMRMMGDANTCSGPINLGNPDEVTIAELARRVIELTGSRSRVIHRPLPVDDPPRRRPDIGLAGRALGWSPRTNLDTGLELTARDIEERLRQRRPRPAGAGMRERSVPRARPAVGGAGAV